MQQLQRAPWSASIVPFILLTLGAFISAVAVIVFEAPFRIAPSGISGVAVILNHLIGTPLGLVVPRPGEAVDPLTLLQWTNARLGRTQRLSAVELRTELPRSNVGKVLKQELREPYWKERI